MRGLIFVLPLIFGCHAETDSADSGPPTALSWTKLDVGYAFACALRSDSQLFCWGDHPADYPSDLDALVTEVAVSPYPLDRLCVVADDLARCWGPSPNGETDVDPTSATLAVGAHFTCGIRRSIGDIRCVGGGAEFGLLDAPAGAYVAIDSHRVHSCALDPEGGVSCWGSDRNGTVNSPPPDPLIKLAVGYQQNCGLLADGTMLCWGDEVAKPTGAYVDVTSGEDSTCAIREDDRSIECWIGGLWIDPDAFGIAAGVPDGRFTMISGRGETICAIDEADAIHCWGDDRYGVTTVPDWVTLDE